MLKYRNQTQEFFRNAFAYYEKFFTVLKIYRLRHLLLNELNKDQIGKENASRANDIYHLIFTKT